ncbi:MAG TPA: cyclic nucleotide-binding domain-containing protein [Spirochaetota bacterium]|nr:cyclic nucleotide-binding domain-containing protein [Spirochaetota bacterium]HPC41281.1 cyclic nucleotide-binding domain-containing protein [Spirochaetota bacterium]HPL15101.1 cyclic nucleotide-binding domain-containing protein [Spirochaetota bacterium]HQF08108.1 cyclic nucleotide-binding domain-containing protein [Spirochaetota bacterium]HQH97005.1 cyclic nucleotide-binding domain-containing protein [Spirochaetota bacterium]
MTWEKILIALIPVPVFYLIYFRYFTFKPEYLKHVEALFSGIAFALVILLVSPYLTPYITIDNPLFAGFVKAATIEKIGAFFIIMLLHYYYPKFSIMESILSAMMFGIGFSAVENVSYAMNFGLPIIAVRILFSVPLHMTTCGIMGYYLGLRKMSETRINRIYYSLMSLAIPIALHGAFDTFILAGGYISYLTSPLLIFLVIILEILMAQAQTMLPLDLVKAMGLRFEDWHVIVHQPSYERWILQSMGMPDREPENFFQWRPGLMRFIFVILFMLCAIVGLAFRTEFMELMTLQIPHQDQIIMLGIFPFSISMILILVGAVNPNFFKNSKIKIPIISDVEVTANGEFEEILVTYDITPASCFLRTAEPYGIGTRKTIRFECPAFTSGEMEGVIVWENHTNPRAPRGSVIQLVNQPAHFFFPFMVRYTIFRIFKGIVFNLKLPGFESIRKLFMRPISTMQDIRVMPSGTVIYSEGDMATEFYLLKKGTVIFYKTKESGEIITIDTVDDEQLFGEMAVIGKNVRSETARCVTDCVIAVADRQNLDALVRNNTEFTTNLLETLAKRVQMSEKVLLENIRSLEKKKSGQVQLDRSALMLLLLGGGNGVENGVIDVPVDMKYISGAIDGIDDETVLEILTRFIKTGASPSSETDLSPAAASSIARIIETFKIKLKIRRR